MNQTPFSVRVGVIAGAVLLGGGFVYVRAGGRLPGMSQAETAPLPYAEAPRTILPSSKSAPLAPLVGPNVSALPSVELRASQPASPKPAVNPAAQPVSRTMIMSGSKSLILSESKDSPLFGVPAATRQPSPLEASPPAAASQPSPLQALKKPVRQQPAISNKRAAPVQQFAPQR